MQAHLDHTLCVVNIETKFARAKLFRFESYWLLHPCFMDVVKEVWNIPLNVSNAATLLCRKFKLLRQELKSWSKIISRLSVAIENTNNTLLNLDTLENQRTLTLPESNFRMIIKKHLLCLLDYQKQYWKKRCTIRWVNFGDENTNFFQAVATNRYHKNNIANMQTSDGLMVEDHTGKEAVLFHAYSDRLGTSSPVQMQFDLPSLIRPNENLDHLPLPFTHEEIDMVIKEMPGIGLLVRMDLVDSSLKHAGQSSRRTFTRCVINFMQELLISKASMMD